MLSRRFKRLTLGFTFVGLFVLIVLVSVGRFFAHLEDKRRYQQEKANLKPRPHNVYVLEPSTRSRTRRYAAELLPWMHARVAAEATGKVAAVHVEPGSTVKTGDVLVELDAALAGIRLRGAEARAKEAERQAEESRRLADKGAESKSEAEAKEANAQIQRAQADEAADTLAKHTIRAPFAGVVNERLVDVGDAVPMNSQVATVVDLEKLRVRFYVNEMEVHAFESGQAVRLKVRGLRGREFEPTIRFMSRSADPETRLFLVEGVLDNGDGELRGGLQGIVEAEVETFRDTLFVPASAVQIAGQQVTVFKITGDESLDLVRIEIGPEVGGFYPVLSGLEKGDRIVIR
jgi:RND family efflux transporter MFP subunit